MGALKNRKNRWFLFISRGVPGGLLGAPWGPWESLAVSWESLGVLGTSLGRSEWSLGVDVSDTDYFVMYIGGSMMFLWFPLGLRHSLTKLRHLRVRVFFSPLQIS